MAQHERIPTARPRVHSRRTTPSRSFDDEVMRKSSKHSYASASLPKEDTKAGEPKPATSKPAAPKASSPKPATQKPPAPKQTAPRPEHRPEPKPATSRPEPRPAAPKPERRPEPNRAPEPQRQIEPLPAPEPQNNYANRGEYAQPVRDISPHSKRNYMNRASTRYAPGNKGVQPKTGIRIPQLIFTLLLVAVVVAAVLLSWNRWFRYDDALDFQGQWLLEGSSAIIVVDDKGIALSQELNYSYELDTWKKEVTYSFGDLHGSGIYRFSADRKILVIIEDGKSDWWTDLRISLGKIPPQFGIDLAKATILNKIFSSTDGTAGSTEPNAEEIAGFLGISTGATPAASTDPPAGDTAAPEAAETQGNPETDATEPEGEGDN